MEQSPPTLREKENNHYYCEGSWDYRNISTLSSTLECFPWQAKHSLTLHGAHLHAIDTAGAYYLGKFLEQGKRAKVTITLTDFSPEIQSLLHLVQSNLPSIAHPNLIAPKRKSLLYHIGFVCCTWILQLRDYFAFIGSLTLSLCRILPRFTSSLRWKALAHEIEIAGLGAIPIIALLSLLIGIVLTYQMGLQLRNYGANIYVVDLLGISLLREFAPLLTAIIMTGHTGSALTAQLSTMVLQEEVDALRTMGLCPNEWLFLPKILALIITIPLLTMLAEIFGILGGMLMANTMLGVSYRDFLDRFPEATGLTNYYIGMLKTPVFAAIIGSIACFQGSRACCSAHSVGEKTTISVIQAIFMIILIDAAFSILFSEFGI